MELCDQRNRLLAGRCHALVLGGPGSGKTTIALLRAKALCGELSPGQSVLFLSFSRAAVRQVLDRSKDLLTRAERKLVDVRTYHRFCLDVLASHGRLLNGRKPQFVTPGAERLRKLSFTGDWDVERSRLALDEGVYCFDEFAPMVARLFERVECVRDLFSAGHPTVVVDEFQDTDDDQWRVVSQIALKSTIVCLADPDQRIFEYRGNVDPGRVDAVRSSLKPEVFDLGGENHRSPRGGILRFADAVLSNSALPETDDVLVASHYPSSFAGTVSLAAIQMFRVLRKGGIPDPSVAVLARTNGLVEDISAILREEQSYGEKTFPPIEHSVEWDAELTAAAARVVGSILEWSAFDPVKAVARTLEAISLYYRLKDAEKHTKVAENAARKYSRAAVAVREGKHVAIKGGRELVDAAGAGVQFSGDPVGDWKIARAVIDVTHGLEELGRAVRLVRLFRATDALATGLGSLWRTAGVYQGASSLIRRVLERERLLGADLAPRGCILMNFHKSKGKEFDGVIIVERKYRGEIFNENWENPPFVEARRVLRVAITRAREKVFILRHHGARPLVDAS